MLENLIRSWHEQPPVLPAAQERRLRLLLLDTTAVAIASLNEPLLLNLQRLRARLDPGPVRIPGMRCSLSPAAAAGILATAACWDELVGGDASCHGRPALAVAPVCLSLGIATGQPLGAVLRALWIGYESAARLGRTYVVPPGEHVDGSWQTVGAAVAAAALLGGDASDQIQAASLACGQMTRSLFAPVTEGRNGRLLLAAMAVERGIALGAAACAGFEGAAAPWESPPLQALLTRPDTAAPGSEAAILTAYFKTEGSVQHCRYAAAASRAWLERHGPWPSPAPAGVRLVLRTYPEACTYCGLRAPRQRIQAQFSLSFAVASTLLLGALPRGPAIEQALADRRLQDLMAQIELDPDPLPPGRWAELEVQADGHDRRRARVETIPGDGGSPLAEPALIAHRQALITPVLGDAPARRLLEHWLAAGLDAPVLPCR